jgi:hypothetical protein
VRLVITRHTVVDSGERARGERRVAARNHVVARLATATGTLTRRHESDLLCLDAEVYAAATVAVQVQLVIQEHLDQRGIAVSPHRIGQKLIAAIAVQAVENAQTRSDRAGERHVAEPR